MGLFLSSKNVKKFLKILVCNPDNSSTTKFTYGNIYSFNQLIIN